MSKIPHLVRSVIPAVALSLALAGCVVGPAPYGDEGGAVVSIAPPGPQYEYYGAPPYPGWFWVGGYWNWAGGRYVWTRGHWQAPRAGFRWVPHQWQRGSRGWHAQPGHWERRR